MSSLSPGKVGPSKKTLLLCHLGALLVVTMWGGSFVATKVLINHALGPIEIYIYRFILAYILLLIICHDRLWARTWRDELLFAVCGLCGSSIYFIAENTAVEYTRVSDVSMITSLSPLLTTLLIGALYRTERPGKWVYLGSIIALCGVGCIVFKDGLPESDESSGSAVYAFIGNMLALSASVSWAVYSLVLRKLNALYTAQFITRKTFFYGLITALPFWLISNEPATTLENLIRPEVLLNIAFLGILCSMLSYILWAYVMGKLGAITTNNYLYIQPIVTMIIAAVLPSLHDPITLLSCVGCVMIIGGLWLGDYMTMRDARRD